MHAWIDGLDAIIFITALVSAVWFYWRVYLPLRRVRRLSLAIAHGQPARGFVRQGAFGIREIIKDLEQIETSLSQLRAQAQSEGYGLKAVLASMAEGVILTDSHRVIRLANGAFRRMFHVTHDPVGRPAFDVILHADVHQLMNRALENNCEATGEITIHQPIGINSSRTVLQLSVSPIRTQPEDTSGLVLVFHDISRIKQLEDVRREFVANVSHELRTPLAIFHGYLETLLAQPEMPEHERLRVFHALKRHSDRLNALVDDLLTLSRMESGRLQLELVTLQIAPFLQRLASDWTLMCQKKNCRLVLDLPPQPGLIEADPLRLEQVFSNLLDNALKYSDPGKSIVIGMEPPSDHSVTFFVKDSGIGIPSDKVDLIFQRFYRVDRARSRDLGGTGLGLAIVKHIVQLHGGQVQASSELGQGTTIRFTIPINTDHELATPSPDPACAAHTH